MTETRTSLNGGFYTASEAARLIGMDSPQRFLRWLRPSGRDAPVIQRQYQKAGPEHEIGFLDMLEIRFVEHFRRQGVSLQSLRVAARKAREVLNVDHPFATSDVKFQTDRTRIFLQTATETGDPRLLNLMTDQLVMYAVIEQLLAKDLEFDVSGLAMLWRPRRAEYPRIVVSPHFAFGQPVISDRLVPTAAIFRTWKAERGDYDAAAAWYEVDRDDAVQAVEFELGH